MKPCRLIRMTDNIIFEIPEVPSGLVKKRVSVPGSRPEIPKVRDDEEQDPEQKESLFSVLSKTLKPVPADGMRFRQEGAQ